MLTVLICKPISCCRQLCCYFKVGCWKTHLERSLKPYTCSALVGTSEMPPSQSSTDCNKHNTMHWIMTTKTQHLLCEIHAFRGLSQFFVLSWPKSDTLTHIEWYQTVHVLTVSLQWHIFFLFSKALFSPASLFVPIYILSNNALKSGTFLTNPSKVLTI